MFFKSKGTNWLLVGLGNPGSQYDATRHNVGFRAIDLIAKDLGVKIDRSRFRALIATADVGGDKVILMKPQTYMNASGLAVEAAAAFYKIPHHHIVVLCDDISLPVGKIRYRKDGSAGGHNGLKSIISALGGQDFPRVKIGVGEKPHPEYDLADWVLSKFSALEEKSLAPAIKNAADAGLYALSHTGDEVAARYNGL